MKNGNTTRKLDKKLVTVLTLSLVLALVVMGMQLPAFASAEADEIITVRWLVPGGTIPDQDRVIAAVNEKLLADGLNIQLDLERIDWDVWEQKTNLMIATQEEFDLIHVMQGSTNFDVYAARGATMGIDEEMLQEYGPDLLNMIGNEVWEATKYDGKIYTIPDMWVDLANDATARMAIRRDIWDKYGVDVPTDWHDMIPQGKKLQDAIFADIGEKWYYIVSADRPMTTASLFREDAKWPFTIGSSSNAGGTQFVIINNDGTTESLLESDAFKASCDYMREFYQAGLVMPDVLSIPRDMYVSQYIDQGKAIYQLGGYWEGIARSTPEAQIEVLPFAVPDEVFITSFFLNSNAISASSKHPEAAIQLMNWIQTKENGQLLCYGEEGVDWAKSDMGDPYFIQANSDGGYFFDMWEFLPYQFRMFSEATPRYMVAPDPVEKVSYAICSGFTFDTSPVQTEWTVLDAAYAQYVWPLQIGVEPYDENIEEVLTALRGMGLDTVLAEYDRQFQEWLAAK